MTRFVMLFLIVSATVGSDAKSATFTVIENTNIRNDAANGDLALPLGITEAGADLTFQGSQMGQVLDIVSPLTNGMGFEAGDTVQVFGNIAAGVDNFLFRFNDPFVIELDFLSNSQIGNDPVWNLFSGSSAGGSPIATTFISEVQRGSSIDLFRSSSILSAGDYILQVDGNDLGLGGNEAYDISISADQLAPVSLPSSIAFLFTGVCLIYGLRKSRVRAC